jgi:UDP-2,3-diacylglucosamine pyrophosphatase LpxH
MSATMGFPHKINVRAVWLSDIHLGYKDCKADYLLDFLESIDTTCVYLVGDIIDVWSMSQSFYWPESHNRVLRKLLKMSREGVRVVYVPGNHDSVFREYCGQSFGGIEVLENAVHITADGKRLLVIHGDGFDNEVRFSRVIHLIGDAAYDFLLFVSRWNYYLRRRLGFGYWSLAAYVKTRIGKAVHAIHLFEQAALVKAKTDGYDGIVCGHIHYPNVIEQDNIIYINDGDWVESCTTLVEKNDGILEIWHWSERNQCIIRTDGEVATAENRQLDLLRAS